MTLRALFDDLDVQSGAHHIRRGEPTISATEPDGLPSDLTALCLQLRSGSLGTADLTSWLDRWDDSALLFLRSVREVTVLDQHGQPARTLRLSWHDDQPAGCRIAGRDAVVQLLIITPLQKIHVIEPFVSSRRSSKWRYPS
ncbi:hypothetical protein AB0M46_38785 [Dactylosporangium sp. NPDC051485]|uniref:hypothetical protein n=1 Tax=Dactylosporangium sp. NPDC051485 TaxID=3154846 RepID=UPI00342F3C39